MADQAPAAALSEQELIQMTRDFVTAGFGPITDEQKSKLSDEFVFRGPIIGPLLKDEYVNAINSFKVWEAFPDYDPNAFGYAVDPADPMRVWFFTRATGTMTGDWPFGGTNLKATGNPIRNGVECNSFIWTADKKLKYMSVGYCVDRINGTTPNGTMNVAVAGLLRSANAEGVWKAITSPAGRFMQQVVNWFRGKHTPGQTPWDDLPEWFKQLPDSKLRNAEGYNK